MFLAKKIFKLLIGMCLLIIICFVALIGNNTFLNLTMAYAYEEDSEPEITMVAAAPGAPSLVIQQYYTAVAFRWTAGENGTEIAISGNNQDYIRMGTRTFNEYAFTELFRANDTECRPQYWYAKSYNPSIGYSSATTAIYDTYDDEGNKTGNDVVRNCIYPVANGMVLTNTTIDVPTKFDQNEFIWDHKAGNGDVIKGTVKIDDKYISNIEVTIPWIAYRTSSVTLNGITIYLRTGPNRCSIRVDSAGVTATRLVFSFGIQYN